MPCKPKPRLELGMTRAGDFDPLHALQEQANLQVEQADTLVISYSLLMLDTLEWCVMVVTITRCRAGHRVP